MRFMRWETGPTDVMAVPEFAATPVDHPGGVRRGSRDVVVRWHAVVMKQARRSQIVPSVPFTRRDCRLECGRRLPTPYGVPVAVASWPASSRHSSVEATRVRPKM